MTTLTIEVPDDVAERIRAAAAARGVAPGDYLVQLARAPETPWQRYPSLFAENREGRAVLRTHDLGLRISPEELREHLYEGPESR